MHLLETFLHTPFFLWTSFVLVLFTYKWTEATDEEHKSR